MGNLKFARPQMGNAIILKKMKLKFIKKIIVMSGILSIQGSLLYGFYYNENLIFNFKTAYLEQIYFPVYAYSLNDTKNNVTNNLANVSAIFGRNNFNETVSAGNQQSELAAKSIPVLLYHGIIDKPDGANILLENFKDQMFALKKAGWQTISIEDFYAFTRGEKQVPDKSFLLTFDDGRKDSYYPVDPILKALDYYAVMFVITGRSLGKETEMSPFHLSEKELRRMAKSGRWEIQSHGKNDHDFYKINANGNEGHFLSNKLWLDNENRLETEEEFTSRINSDFISAKSGIEKELGAKAISFAFPFGDFGQNSVNFPEAESIISDIVKLIYPLSFYQVWPGKGFYFNYPDKNQFLIKRIDVKPDWTADNLLQILDTGREKTLPFADDFNDYNGWVRTWGELSFAGNSLILSSRASTTGSSAFLGGTYLWQDYVFKSKIDLVKGQTFFLLARYTNDKNYVWCSFSPTHIKIGRMINGSSRVLVERKGNFESIGKDREFGIGVYDDAVSCYVDDKIAVKLYDGLHKNLRQGGIGFKTWDPQANNSELIIKKISVEEIK